MKLAEIITRNPICTGSRMTLAEAAQQMKILDVGLLPVCEKGRLVGTVTDRDITVRGVAHRLDSNSATVSEVMTADLVCCYEDQDVKEAVDLMARRQLRRLPVLNRQNQLVGIISLADLATRAGAPNLAGHVLEHISTSDF